MKKRKRAPGGGRKPSGAFRNLTIMRSVRMSQELYDQLERARRTSGHSFNQELLDRAGKSFDRDRDLSRDRALRAFCFLFSELAQVICVNPPLVPGWRFDPWLFQAFKLAIPKLLDHFQPPGKMKPPEFWQFVREAPDVDGFPGNKEERTRITESPEAMADYAVQKVLSNFSDPRQVGRMYKGGKGMEEKMADPADRRIHRHLIQEWETTYYGMIDAQQDLAPREKSQGGKQ